MLASARTTLVALVACTCLATSSSARADDYSASSGPTAATLSYESYGSSVEPDFALRISRGGQVLHDDLLAFEGCQAEYCQPLMPQGFGGSTEPLQVVDLDADGEPEVFVSAYWGGAHCCFLVKIFRLAADGLSYVEKTKNFLNTGVGVRQLDDSGPMELLSRDNRFAYRFASYAASMMPIQVWRFLDGRFVDVTEEFPARIRAEARSAWRYYRKAIRGGEMLGLAAGWAADQYRLGRRAYAMRTLRREARRGHLKVFDFDGKAKPARNFILRLRRTLDRFGY
jgi:hypothetical protein